jgi:hypothetical protein
VRLNWPAPAGSDNVPERNVIVANGGIRSVFREFTDKEAVRDLHLINIRLLRLDDSAFFGPDVFRSGL